MSERLLVADVAAKSKNWALTTDGEHRLREATPEGWRIHVIKSQTSSDGDGPPRPSDEVMEAIRDAEIYFGFGIPKALFLEAHQQGKLGPPVLRDVDESLREHFAQKMGDIHGDDDDLPLR